MDDSKLFINAYDVNNKIKLNIGELLQMMDKVDMSQFIRNYYKIIRNQYVKVYSNTSAFSSKKIPFDDLHFYNMSIYRQIDFSAQTMCPVSYFTLGNVISSSDREIVNFSNPINDAMVRILEMTNAI